MSVTWTTTKVLGAVVLLLLGAGTLHRWAYASRTGVASAYRAPSADLSEIPSRLGGYAFRRDLPLSAEVLQVAGVDRFVYREYVAPATGQPVSLYIGYWGRENRGMGHGPEVCYPATGWRSESPVEQRVVRFQGPDGVTTDAVMALHHFGRIEPEGIARVAVGFVAVVDGQFRASSRGVFLHRPPRSRKDGFLAQVQVSMPVTGERREATDACIVGFMERLLPHLSRCLFGTPGKSNQDSAPEQAGGNA